MVFFPNKHKIDRGPETADPGPVQHAGDETEAPNGQLFPQGQSAARLLQHDQQFAGQCADQGARRKEQVNFSVIFCQPWSLVGIFVVFLI